MCVVYSLIDPRNNEVRYIGITEDVYSRFYQHLQCNENNIDKNVWIQDLKDQNAMLIMKTIELVETIEEARNQEQYWIHYYLSDGARLLNVDISRSFSYEDFLTAFGTVKEKKPRKKRVEVEILKKGARGSAVELIKKVIENKPSVKNAEICRATGLSRSYVSNIRENHKI